MKAHWTLKLAPFWGALPTLDGTYIHSGFHPTLDISVAFMLNKIDGIWVDGSKVQHDEAVFCRAWRAAFQLTGHGKLGNASLVCNDRPWRPPF